MGLYSNGERHIMLSRKITLRYPQLQVDKELYLRQWWDKKAEAGFHLDFFQK